MHHNLLEILKSEATEYEHAEVTKLSYVRKYMTHKSS